MKKKILLIFIILVIFGVLSVSGYNYYTHTKKTENNLIKNEVMLNEERFDEHELEEITENEENLLENEDEEKTEEIQKEKITKQNIVKEERVVTPKKVETQKVAEQSKKTQQVTQNTKKVEEAQKQVETKKVDEPQKQVEIKRVEEPQKQVETKKQEQSKEETKVISSKSIYDYDFDIEAIKKELIKVGESMGLKHKTTDGGKQRTPSNSSWSIPVTANENLQGKKLERALKNYVSSMPQIVEDYGGNKIEDFTIYVEQNGNGSYTFYFLY